MEDVCFLSLALPGTYVFILSKGSHCPLFFLKTLGCQKTHLCYVSPTIEDVGEFCLLAC